MTLHLTHSGEKFDAGILCKRTSHREHTTEEITQPRPGDLLVLHSHYISVKF